METDREVTYVSPSGVRQVASSPSEKVRLRFRGWRPVEQVNAEKKVKAAKERAKRGKPEDPGPPDEPGPPNNTPPNQS